MRSSQVQKPIEVPSPQRPWYFDVAILVALAPFVFSAVRVWLYAGGDMAIFLTLIRTLDLVTVLVGTVTVLAQGAALLFLMLFLLDWRVRDRARTWFSLTGVPTVMSVALLVLIVTANGMFWVGLAFLAILVGLYFLIRLVPGGRRITNWFVPSRASKKTSDIVTVIASVAITLLMAPSNMWLPLEQVTLADASTEHAYVLQVTSEWTTMLTDDKKVRIYPTAEVTERAVCRSAIGGTLGSLLLQDPQDAEAPRCTYQH